MASYYYLVASLPDLRADGELPMSYEEFLDNCRTSVSDATYQRLSELNLASCEGPLMKRWAGIYGSLMKELNYQRSLKLGKSYTAEYEKDILSAQVAGSALAAKNPLEAEKILLKYEFELLDDLVGMHLFDEVYLMGYAMKLKLLERQNCFEQKKGKAEFKHLFEQVQQRVHSL